MAKAYAVLVSLMNTIAIERTPRNSQPPIPPIPFDGALIDALLERVGFFVECLEQGSKIPRGLEIRIAELAEAAEDAIEAPIVDQILARSTGISNERRSLLPDQDLETIIRGMDSIKAEIRRIQVTAGMKVLHLQTQKQVTSSSSVPHRERTKMVGLEDNKIQIMEELVGMQSSLAVIPIVGMGGIGKTTLAQNIYDDKLIEEYFDARAWVTVSQEYNAKNILKEIFHSLNGGKVDTSDDENFGDRVYKHLCGRRYFIILDDIWNIDVWIEIRRFFPNNENGSRIMVTTRLLSPAKELSTCTPHEMKILNDDHSWDLLCEKVFGEEDCPTNLEDIGKKIAKHCGGLPLAITVVGGLLAQSKTLEYWQHIVDDFSSSIYLNDQDNCLNIISLSYNHLPVHLKACFLSLGAFLVGNKIDVSLVKKLWVAEGFLKPLKCGKTCEEIAEQYLKDLIERNLIAVQQWTEFSREIAYCTIHDVLKELCLREVQEENFPYVVNARNLAIPGSIRPRCFVIKVMRSPWEQHPQISDSLKLIKSYPRSLIISDQDLLLEVLNFHIFWLLRVVLVVNKVYNCESLDHIFPNLVNLRYINFHGMGGQLAGGISSCMGLFRNLQMLVTSSEHVFARQQLEIWNLLHLRHIEFYDEFTLSEPPSSSQQEGDCIILEYLQALMFLQNCRFCDEVIKRIPNVKEIRVKYDKKALKKWSHYCVHNLGSLQRLEHLQCQFNETFLLQNLAFPRSLKTLTLKDCKLLVKDMSVIGSLPNLEVLKLEGIIIIGSTWEPIEGEFPHLKVLYMWMEDLKNLNADSSHFPQLEQIIIKRMRRFKEIPLDFANISTLQLIQLTECCDSLYLSAKNILEEQENLGNEGLVVEVCPIWRSKLTDRMAGSNFIVKPVFDEYFDSEDEDGDEGSEYKDEDSDQDSSEDGDEGCRIS